MRLLLAESKHTTSAIHSVLKAEGICATGGWEFVVGRHWDRFGTVLIERDNVNVHRAAANIIVSKSRAARGSVCNVLLSGVLGH